MSEFINLTEENLPREHLCCIIRNRKPHPGGKPKGNGWRSGSKKDIFFGNWMKKGRFLSNMRRWKARGSRSKVRITSIFLACGCWGSTAARGMRRL